tara:strand:+ start:991 stop:1173 length:183 start_codon:yes stop_codon:yes gene_type:complete
MKVYITEFKYKGKYYEGPPVVASSFSDAETKAENYGCNVVGILDLVISDFEESEYQMVLH